MGFTEAHGPRRGNQRSPRRDSFHGWPPTGSSGQMMFQPNYSEKEDLKFRVKTKTGFNLAIHTSWALMVYARAALGNAATVGNWNSGSAWFEASSSEVVIMITRAHAYGNDSKIEPGNIGQKLVFWRCQALISGRGIEDAV